MTLVGERSKQNNKHSTQQKSFNNLLSNLRNG